MVSTHELSDSQDLSAELAYILKKFQFPLDLLDRFPHQKRDLSGIVDPQEAERIIQEQHEAFRSRLDLWQHEVRPLNIDWAQLIEELQPLFMENYRRHTGHSHPSEFGIVMHLDFHLFKRASDIQVNGTRAEGSIIAIVRDPNVFEVEENPSPGNGKAISEMLYDTFEVMTFKDRRVRRKPEPIEFVKVGDAWKVATIPFR